MPTWTSEQLDWIGRMTEIEIAPRRSDGTLREFTTIWIVRVDDGLYVRSWHGAQGGWFRTAERNDGGRIRTGGTEYEVRFEPARDIDRDAIDSAYRRKYGRSSYVDAMVADGPAATTTRLIPG